MTEKSKSLKNTLRDGLNEARTESSGGLLDNIPAFGSDGKPLAQEASAQSWVRLGKRPRASEIDYKQTSDDLLLEGKAVLKDGRYVTWP